jgi:hypothetical protein
MLVPEARILEPQPQSQLASAAQPYIVHTYGKMKPIKLFTGPQYWQYVLPDFEQAEQARN